MFSLRTTATPVTLLVVAKAAGVVEVAYRRTQSDDAADALDGNHQRRVVQADTARLPLEQRKQQLLLADVPAAIAGREAVGVVPTQLVDAQLQVFLHLVGTAFGNDSPQRIGYKDPHHVALLLQSLLINLKLLTTGADEAGISLGSLQLTLNNAPHIEVGQCRHHLITIAWTKPRTNLADDRNGLPTSAFVRFLAMIAHRLEDVFKGYQ